MRQDSSLISSLLYQFDDTQKSGWKLSKHKQDIKIWYKYEPDNPIIWSACECEIEGDILHICALFGEIDLYSLWVPQVKTSQIVAHITQFRKIVRVEAKMPWPFSNRDAIMQGCGTILKDRKAVIIGIRSVVDDKIFNIQMPQPTQNIVRAVLYAGGAYIEQLDQHKCRLRFISNANPRLKLIPQWLINLVARKVAYLALQKFKTILNTIQSHGHEQRIEERKEFYDRIRQRLHLIKH